jgi:hypothetical protein
MLDKLFGYPAHKYLHFIGALIVAIGLPLNKVVMSIGTIWLISNVVLKADFKIYWKTIKANTVLWLIIGLFLFHLIGLFWSEDLGYGLRDIRSKLPFLVLPLALIVFPLERLFLKWVLIAFLISLSITSCINFFWGFVLNDTTIIDLRDISLFGSHIRYGLLIVFGVGITLIKGFQEKKYSWWIWTLWFLAYTLITQVLTAYFALGVMIIGLILFGLNKLQNKKLRLLFLSIFSLFILFISVFTFNFLNPEKTTLDIDLLPSHTALGNPYFHHPKNGLTENGQPIMLFINEKELENNWKTRSTYDFHGADDKGHSIKGTLIRYMASKGLTKDEEGMDALTDEDIRWVEQGVPSITIVEGKSLKRIEELKFEIQSYLLGESPSGNSLLQRFEYWKTAWYIIQKNLWFGVGTGDVQNEFDQAYEELNSPLEHEFRHRSHNQFLTFWVSFGIGGLLLFIALWGLLLKQTVSTNNWLALSFVLIALASFIPEDTLETQQGVTFVGFFVGLLGRRNKAA